MPKTIICFRLDRFAGNGVADTVVGGVQQGVALDAAVADGKQVLYCLFGNSLALFGQGEQFLYHIRSTLHALLIAQNLDIVSAGDKGNVKSAFDEFDICVELSEYILHVIHGKIQ